MTIVGERGWFGLCVSVVTSAWLIAACSSDDAKPSDGGPGGSAGEGTTGGRGGADGAGMAGDGGEGLAEACAPGGERFADVAADELFGADSVARFDFNLPADQWAQLKANARDEQYVEAEACYRGERLGTVGLRFKGGFGTLGLCFNDAGEQTCAKLSMKVKFNEYVDGQTFHGLKRLNFHSMIRDASKLHERLAYGLYRANGIAAPRSSWANLRVNGELQGLFSMVEEIDGPFTDEYFADDPEGDLYKEAWPVTDDSGYYAERIDTNESTATHERFIAFANAMNDAGEADLLSTLAEWMDVEELQRYMAVDDAILNWDGITTFYVGEDGHAGNHNYFIYDAPQASRFRLVPWDLDGTFVVQDPMSRSPRWYEQPATCPHDIHVFNSGTQVRAAGCDPVFRALGQDFDGYRAAVEALLAGPFAEGELEQQVERDAAMIADAVASDPFGEGAPAWEAAVDELKRDLPALRQRLRLLADREAPVPLSLGFATVNDFEDANRLELLLGSTLATSTGSSGARDIITESPLAGLRSLQLSFDFRNTAAPWAHFLYFSIPLTEGTVDLSQTAFVRFNARSNVPRGLRVDLESLAHSASNEGIRYGWSVVVGAEPTVIEVPLSALGLASWVISEGRDPGDDPATIVQSVTGLAFTPEVLQRDGTGFLPEGVTDSGYLIIDDLEFVAASPSP